MNWIINQTLQALFLLTVVCVIGCTDYRVFVVDKNKQAVLEFQKNGDFVADFIPPDVHNKRPRTLFIGPDGDFFLGTWFSGGRIIRYDDSGAFKKIFVVDSQHIDEPVRILYKDPYHYVLSNDKEKITILAGWEPLLPAVYMGSVDGEIDGVTYMRTPLDMTLLNGNFYVAQFGSNNLTPAPIQEFTPKEDTLLPGIQIGGGKTIAAAGITTDGSHLYVSDQSENRIMRYNMASGDASVFISNVDKPGKVAISPGKFFYVISDHKRILRYEPDGTFVDEFVSEGEADTQFITDIVFLDNK